jgi:hypothetical protein
MAARHFGLHVDEDWLAVAGKFQNTGSSAGSDILGLYSAVASEVNLRMDRQTRLSAADVRCFAATMGFVPLSHWMEDLNLC